MAASLPTSPFKLQAPLLSVNSGLPRNKSGFKLSFFSLLRVTSLVSRRDLRLCACAATYLYLQLLNDLHLDSALSGAAVIEGVLVVQVPASGAADMTGLSGISLGISFFLCYLFIYFFVAHLFGTKAQKRNTGQQSGTICFSPCFLPYFVLSS